MADVVACVKHAVEGRRLGTPRARDFPALGSDHLMEGTPASSRHHPYDAIEFTV